MVGAAEVAPLTFTSPTFSAAPAEPLASGEAGAAASGAAAAGEKKEDVTAMAGIMYDEMEEDGVADVRAVETRMEEAAQTAASELGGAGRSAPESASESAPRGAGLPVDKDGDGWTDERLWDWAAPEPSGGGAVSANAAAGRLLQSSLTSGGFEGVAAAVLRERERLAGRRMRMKAGPWTLGDVLRLTAGGLVVERTPWAEADVDPDERVVAAAAAGRRAGGVALLVEDETMCFAVDRDGRVTGAEALGDFLWRARERAARRGAAPPPTLAELGAAPEVLMLPRLARLRTAAVRYVQAAQGGPGGTLRRRPRWRRERTSCCWRARCWRGLCGNRARRRATCGNASRSGRRRSERRRRRARRTRRARA